jgi:hypothetical protein
MVADGEGGAEISCTVTANAGGYEVSVSAAQPTTFDGGVSVAFDANFTLDATDAGSGSLSVRGGRGLNALSSNTEPCDFRALQVAPGKVWAIFDCIAYDRLSSNTTFCAVTGVLAFENCTT